MLGLFLTLLGFVVIFVLVSRFAVSFTARQFGKVVGERHMSAEYVMETGRAPPPWVRPALVAVGDDVQVRRRLLHNLDELVRYFARAPVFENEPARVLFLERLETVRAAWDKAELGEIFSPEGTPWPPLHNQEDPAPPAG
jgi:hypothetical protein